MTLETFIRTEFDSAPHAVRPLLVLLKTMVDEAWENGCAVGHESTKEDAFMLVDRAKTLKEAREALKERL